VSSQHRRRRPALLSPDGAPVRWLLTDGYVYDIRDDQDYPPWQEGRWASMNGVRRSWRETLASPLEDADLKAKMR
jgi:hypothetical protein